MVDEIRATGVNFGTSPVVRLGSHQGQAAVSKSSVEESDTVEFSELATLRSKYDQMPEIRSELVSQLRSEIANGTYETDDKLDQAVDNLLEDVL
jgi:negative regulator of flagellin synthesis FlgM